jgi:hypothetical protein
MVAASRAVTGYRQASQFEKLNRRCETDPKWQTTVRFRKLTTFQPEGDGSRQQDLAFDTQ